jgi:DNA replication protein DnaC
MTNLETSLGNLRLLGMKEALECRVAEAMKSSLGYRDFMNLLLEDEHLYRANRRSESLRKKAAFKDKVLLAHFDADPKRGVSKLMIKELQTLSFLRTFENIIFIGGTGVGKSFLAQAIGHASCLSGNETRFIPVNYLFEQFKAAEKAGQVLLFLKKLSQAEIIILDDFGLRKYSHEEATLLYQIIEDRYQKGSTIITSQVKPLGWKDLFDDEVMAEAIIDRLATNAHVIELKSGSYRKNHAPKNKMGVESQG